MLLGCLHAVFFFFCAYGLCGLHTASRGSSMVYTYTLGLDHWMAMLQLVLVAQDKSSSKYLAVGVHVHVLVGVGENVSACKLPRCRK